MRTEDTWIQTYRGRQFWPMDPQPEDIDILDVAHSLSMLCRFNGHCRAFYSVAEHCVRVSRACLPEHALWGLLHDIAEAYIGDIARPVKQQFQTIAETENRLLLAAAARFGLAWPIPHEVAEFDEVLLATEARDLMQPAAADWRLRARPLAERIHAMEPAQAERAFLERFAELESDSSAARSARSL
jgi:5'-deoxynucleotidase YfbR-like HD superfamily hydrolase